MSNPKKPKIAYILLGSSRRVGKDTSANFIHAELAKRGLPAIRLSFAESLRKELDTAVKRIGFPELDPWTEKPDEKEKCVRPLLIALGQARRFFNSNYWVEQLIYKARHFQSIPAPVRAPGEYVFVVVSDWRFPNELERIEETEVTQGNKVFPIHVSRPSHQYAGAEEQENDPLCEALAWGKIYNESTLQSLEFSCATMTDMILETLK